MKYSLSVERKARTQRLIPQIQTQFWWLRMASGPHLQWWWSRSSQCGPAGRWSRPRDPFPEASSWPSPAGVGSTPHTGPCAGLPEWTWWQFLVRSNTHVIRLHTMKSHGNKNHYLLHFKCKNLDFFSLSMSFLKNVDIFQRILDILLRIPNFDFFTLKYNSSK